MFLFSMLLLFAATCLGGWLALFPDGRDAAGAALLGWGRRLDRRWRGARQGGASTVVAVLVGTSARLGRCAGLPRRYRLLSAGAMALVLLPPLLALLLGGRLVLPGFEPDPREVNQQVAGLLRGERLAAPQPLPPTAFTTMEVTLVRPRLAGANRNWDLLDAEFAQRLLAVFRVMREQHGYEMVLLEGYRSPERQDELADAGSHVTNARAFQSWHQFGLAGDCAFLRDGKVVISERDTWALRGYQLYGEAAEAAGLTWGGRWKMMDFGHAELRRKGR